MDFNSILNSLTGGQPAQQNSAQGQQGYNDWNQMIGAAPPDQFGQAAHDAMRNADPNEYVTHITPGLGGTDPLGGLGGGAMSGIASSVLGALMNHGVGQGQIAQSTGLGSLNPGQMSPTDLGSLLQWTQQNHPGAFGQVASQYQSQPNILQAIMGNPALLSMATSLGAQFLANRGQQGSGGASYRR